MSLTYGSMCSGYGGLEEGVQSVLGGRTLWHVEFDAAPSKILEHRYPNVRNYGDLTTTDWHSVPRVNVITAGFPCQPFSHAGKRLGANDERHLWPYICTAIDILRPRLVVLENVRGLLSGQGEPDPEWVANLDAQQRRWRHVVDLVIQPKIRKARNRGQLDRTAQLEADAVRLLEQRRAALDTVRRARARLVRAIGAVARDLANIGYDLRWYGLRAADVGAAHGRFRVFLFATPADADLSGLEGLPTPAVNDMGEGKTVEWWDDWAPRQKSSTGRKAVHGKSLSIEAQRLLPTPRATDGTKGGPNQRGSSGDLMLPSAVQKMLPTPSVADVEGGRKHRSGDRSNELLLNGIAAAQDWREYEAAIRRHEHALGRPAPEPTEPGAKGQPRLSPKFVEWLMMLPDGWVTDVPGISRNDQLKALGNGVVPPQAAAATRAFLADTAQERAA